MNNRQKHYFRLYLAIFFSLITQPAFSTEIFRSEDATGSVTYSDKAIEGARQIRLPNRAYRHLHQVKKVYDGDTIILKNGQRVRLLGINTPEIESRHRAKEPGGLAAKTWLENQLTNRKVYLEYDLEKHDKYNRLLAHVFLPDGKHLNLELLRNGLAFVSIIPPNIRHADQFSQAQKQAEKKKLGIWKLPEYQVHPLSQITSGHKGWRRYIGALKKIQHRRRYTYLIFNDHVNIRIANDHHSHFPELETYLGKKLEVRGWLSRRGEKFSILIYHPSALILQ
ncbi:thermonuclease family protein [Nitrosomonas sp.]|uniref:thermonuclease family protein n=1 Tax=Nitrosomonas sp. TaxID=42353 RepID=UPI0020808402|nr:thermonuclease family protein [Nitrosomonas sp.]GJL75350.1 MAG: nuclease [Nitrosomonas sp.]